MTRLLPFLLLASSLAGQTVQNANFQAPVTFTQSDAVGDQWVPNTVPGWTIGPGPGVPGTFAGIERLVSSCGPPAQTMYSNDPTVTQDLGQQPAGSYTLTVGICDRADGVGSGATYTVSLGQCSKSALNSTIPAGTIQSVTLTCQFAGGDMMVGLGCSGPQCNFASVAVASTAPFVYQIQGGPAVSFPMQAPPACTPADGTCSIQIQVVMPASSCFLSPDWTLMTCTGQQGTIQLVKSVTLPTPQKITYVVATSQ